MSVEGFEQKGSKMMAKQWFVCLAKQWVASWLAVAVQGEEILPGVISERMLANKGEARASKVLMVHT